VSRGVALVIGLLAGLAPAAAQAQTNIDQGKSPAQIFAETCAACHKGARGLANGKGSFALTEFLHEHYTTSRDQAAALAAYVLGAGSGPKPPIERPANAAGEPKTNGRQTRKPEEGTSPATAKLQPAPAEEAKPRDGAIAVEEPSRTGRQPTDKRHPITATRGRHREPEAPSSNAEPGADVNESGTAAREPAAREPAAADANPRAPETPSADANPTAGAAVSTDSNAGENAPVPRDNIPD